MRLFRDCGAIFGDWDADHDGLFVADGGSWSGECAAAGDDPTPAWLLTAAAHRPDGDGHVLLDVDGSVVARLVPGEEPTLPPTILQSQAAPPVVTDQTRRQLAPAEPLPANTAPADGRTPLGRWTPTDAPEGSESHVRFGTDAAWNGSDGCNGLDGRWRAGSDGALLATGTGMTRLVGCESIAVETRLTRAARAGFDGDTLVLYDRQGAELGRFEPSDGAAALEPHTDEALNRGDLPPVDAETAAAQRARFAEAIGEDYDATVLVRCICPSTAPVRIEVRGGVLTRATRAPGAEQEDVARGAGSVGVPTVDGIHGILERIAAERGGRVRARYDDRGVPLRAEVDHRADAVDDEVTYLVTDVVAAADPS